MRMIMGDDDDIDTRSMETIAKWVKRHHIWVKFCFLSFWKLSRNNQKSSSALGAPNLRIGIQKWFFYIMILMATDFVYSLGAY